MVPEGAGLLYFSGKDQNLVIGLYLVFNRSITFKSLKNSIALVKGRLATMIYGL